MIQIRTVNPEAGNQKEIRSLLAGGNTIGVIAVNTPGLVISGEDWRPVIESSIESEISARKAFKIVDVSSRKARLTELAYTQTGLTAEQRNIGQELAVNAAIFVRMTAAPKQECKKESVLNDANPGGAIIGGLIGNDRNAVESNNEMSFSDRMGTSMRTGLQGIAGRSDTGVRYMTVFVQAKLTNLETGQSITRAISKPFRLKNQAGNTECPSELAALNGALNMTAKEIADFLSPSTEGRSVELLTDVSDLDGDAADRAKSDLKAGVKWAVAGDMEKAQDRFQSALSSSSNKSLSANWNLAIIKWQAGDYDGAKKNFDQCFRLASPDWLTEPRQKLWADFKKEMQMR